jgi:hypothetical protein
LLSNVERAALSLNPTLFSPITITCARDEEEWKSQQPDGYVGHEPPRSEVPNRKELGIMQTTEFVCANCMGSKEVVLEVDASLVQGSTTPSVWYLNSPAPLRISKWLTVCRLLRMLTVYRNQQGSFSTGASPASVLPIHVDVFVQMAETLQCIFFLY